jgi:hypothetical protein
MSEINPPSIDRFQASHDHRVLWQSLIMAASLALVFIICLVGIVAAVWPPMMACDATKKCIIVYDWGAHTIEQLKGISEFLQGYIGILLTAGSGILYARGAFDAYLSRKPGGQ